jgi:hypothetical protein
MKQLFYKTIGSLLLLPITFADSFALSLDSFREEVFRPENLPAGLEGDMSAEAKVNFVINFIVDLILYAAGSVSVLMLVIGGIMFIGSTGNQDRKDKAVKIIKFALIGLFIVILAFAIVTNVIDLLFRATT